MVESLSISKSVLWLLNFFFWITAMTIIVMIRLAMPQFSSVVTAGEKVSPERERLNE